MGPTIGRTAFGRQYGAAQRPASLAAAEPTRIAQLHSSSQEKLPIDDVGKCAPPSRIFDFGLKVAGGGSCRLTPRPKTADRRSGEVWAAGIEKTRCGIRSALWTVGGSTPLWNVPLRLRPAVVQLPPCLTPARVGPSSARPWPNAVGPYNRPNRVRPAVRGRTAFGEPCRRRAGPNRPIPFIFPGKTADRRGGGVWAAGKKNKRPEQRSASSLGRTAFGPGRPPVGPASGRITFGPTNTW